MTTAPLGNDDREVQPLKKLCYSPGRLARGAQGATTPITSADFFSEAEKVH